MFDYLYSSLSSLGFGNYQINFEISCTNEQIIVTVDKNFFMNFYAFDVYVNDNRVKQNVKEEYCVAYKVNPTQNNATFKVQLTDNYNKYKSEVKEVKYVYNPVSLSLASNLDQEIADLKQEILNSSVEGKFAVTGEQGAGKSLFIGSLRKVNGLQFSAVSGSMSDHVTKDVKLFKVNEKISTFDVFGCTLDLETENYQDHFLDALIQGRLLSGINYSDKKYQTFNYFNPTSDKDLLPTAVVLAVNGPGLLLSPYDSIRKLSKVYDKLLNRGFSPLVVVTCLDKLVDCEFKEYLDVKCLEHPNVKILCKHFDELLNIKTSGDLCFVASYAETEVQTKAKVANYFLLQAFVKVISKIDGGKHKIEENALLQNDGSVRATSTWKKI